MLNAPYVVGLLMDMEDAFACLQVVLSLHEIHNYKNEFSVIFVIQSSIQYYMSVIFQTFLE